MDADFMNAEFVKPEFVKRAGRFLLAGFFAIAISACGKDDAKIPLAYVPADTPYLMANLEPMDEELQDVLLSQFNAQMSAQLPQYRQTVASISAKQPQLASLLGAALDELDGKTIQQFAKDNGIDLRGLWALYGLGLSPVQRIPLTDSSTFNAYVTRLEDAYGSAIPSATVEGITYRHLDLDELGLQAILAVADNYAVFAVLPVGNDAMLRMALGLERPATSVLDEQRLARVADAKGYLPYTVSYLDLTKLPALLIKGSDPLLNAVLAKRITPSDDDWAGFPASCQADLQRLAGRMPMISFGLTELDAKRMTMQSSFDFADDIVAAFSKVAPPLPGLGAELSAPFDLAIAFPLEQSRKFWTAQIDAVAAKPFTCPNFADINAKIAELRPKVQMLAIPPFGTLRGVRVSMDKFAADADAGLPQFSARILIASTNPVGLLALAQTIMPGIAELGLSPDAKPVMLPSGMTALTGQPGSAAMSDHAIAIGLGDDAAKQLTAMLAADIGAPGDLMRMHLSGDMYRAWLDTAVEMVGTATDSDDAESKAMTQRARQQVEAMRKQAERIQQISIHMAMQEDGLVITSTTELR